MNPLERAENGPEEFARHLAEQRARMREAGAFVRYAHSRTALLREHVRRLVARLDRSGREGRISS